MCGISPLHIRKLVENVFDGGKGYSPIDVAKMTLDQIYMSLCDRKNLRSKGKGRTTALEGCMALGVITDKDGYARGRDKDGNPIRARIVGESLVARLKRQRLEKEVQKTQAPSKRELRRNARK